MAARPAFVSKGCCWVWPSSSSWHRGLWPKRHDESSRINPSHSRNDRYHRNMSPGDAKLGKEVPVIQQAVMALILPPPKQSLLLTQPRFIKGLSSLGMQLSYQHEHDLQHHVWLTTSWCPLSLLMCRKQSVSVAAAAHGFGWGVSCSVGSGAGTNVQRIRPSPTTFQFSIGELVFTCAEKSFRPWEKGLSITVFMPEYQNEPDLEDVQVPLLVRISSLSCAIAVGLNAISGFPGKDCQDPEMGHGVFLTCLSGLPASQDYLLGYWKTDLARSQQVASTNCSRSVPKGE